MKRFFGILFSLLLVLSLFSCGKTAEYKEDVSANDGTEPVALDASYPDSTTANALDNSMFENNDVAESSTESEETSTTTEPETESENTTGGTEPATGGQDPNAIRSGLDEPNSTKPVETVPPDPTSNLPTKAADKETIPASEEPESSDGGIRTFLSEHAALILIVLFVLLAALAGVFVYLMRSGKKTQPAAPIREVPQSEYPRSRAESPALRRTDDPDTSDQYIGADPTRYMTAITFDPDKTAPIKVVRVHNVGKRKNQEDSFGVSNIKDEALCKAKGVMAVVADGMGGLKGGEDVSSIAVLSMLQGFSDMDHQGTDADELSRLLNITVQNANDHLRRTVGLRKGGSTLMAVIVHARELSWISVGDSRTALFRGGKLTDLNQKHIYAAELNEMVRQNRITMQQAMNHPDRNKLTSYIGMGELKYVDRSVRPMQLDGGDKIILMSDGIFNTLTDPEIEQILSLPIEQIGDHLESAVLRKNNPYQDNFTAVVLEIPAN